MRSRGTHKRCRVAIDLVIEVIESDGTLQVAFRHLGGIENDYAIFTLASEKGDTILLVVFAFARIKIASGDIG